MSRDDDRADLRPDQGAGDRPRLSPTWIPPSERLLSPRPPTDEPRRRVIDLDQVRREGFALLSDLASLD